MESFNLGARCFVALLLISLCFSCEKDEAVTTTQGRFSLEITDAPIDDANVQAVFVTVTDVRVGDRSLTGFNRTTVEISALTNGVTQLLADADLEARTYNGVEIVLDEANDATNSGGPGCYIVDGEGNIVPLRLNGTSTLRAPVSNFTLGANSRTEAVIDFDLRKALVRTQNEAEPYAFAASSRLETSLRFVNKEATGTLSGTINNQSGEEDASIVVYAYAAGTFSETEMEGATDDDHFLNAVASTTTSGSGDYQLSFLEAGEYELIVVAYTDDDNNGQVEMKGRFRLSALLGLDLAGVSVAANSTTTADFTLESILP